VAKHIIYSYKKYDWAECNISKHTYLLFMKVCSLQPCDHIYRLQICCGDDLLTTFIIIIICNQSKTDNFMIIMIY